VIARLPELQPLLLPGVCGFASAIPGREWELHELERSAVRSVSKRHRSEFTAGRYCAHQALLQLDVRDTAIPSGRNRAPVWPPGIIGSISHSRTCAVAIVTHATEDFLSLGIDIEEAEPVDDDLMCRIGAQQEYDLLSGIDRFSAGILTRLLFSMKEAVFKCLFGWSSEFLEFHDLQLLRIDGERNFTMGRLRHNKREVAVRIYGKFAITPEFICCTAALHKNDVRDTVRCTEMIGERLGNP
jgi:4'-phosphopantetheinyl transferase EntD